LYDDESIEPLSREIELVKRIAPGNITDVESFAIELGEVINASVNDPTRSSLRTLAEDAWTQVLGNPILERVFDEARFIVYTEKLA
jgi:hypothetical protein